MSLLLLVPLPRDLSPLAPQLKFLSFNSNMSSPSKGMCLSSPPSVLSGHYRLYFSPEEAVL